MPTNQVKLRNFTGIFAFLTLRQKKILPFLGTVLISGLVTLVVYQNAWISEDAFITLRYVSNTLDGFGAVFNSGERVQGYTHPLWFLLLTTTSLVFPDPITNAIYLGVLLTFATCLLVGFSIYRTSQKAQHSFLLFTTFGICCALSNSWVSFQTGGLENALSHFLIAVILLEMCVFQRTSPGRLVLWAGLLCLNRLDLVVLIAPFCIYEVIHVRGRRAFLKMMVYALPLIAWLLFSWVYYGDIIPNTAYAKIGIYPTWLDSVTQGLAYLQDWMTYDSLAAAFSLVLLLFSLNKAKDLPPKMIALGIILYTLWIICIGGDFMRGRLFTAVFFTTVELGLLISGSWINIHGFNYTWRTGATLLVLGIALLNQIASPNPGNTISEEGIVDERAFYPGYTFAYYNQNHRLENPYLDLEFAHQLRDFASICGPITIHNFNPGTLGYLSGPQVSIIDLLGLTDEYIAKLPNQTLVKPHPRPGHPEKNIPEAYLISRSDISTIPGWEKYIRAMDCSILESFKP